MDIQNYMTPNEAAYRWGVNTETVKNKLKMSVNKAEIELMESQGLIKSFIEPSGKNRSWIVTVQAMEIWFGEKS